MRHFSDTELTRMQGHQTGSMMDTCVILTRVAGAGDYGYGPPIYTEGAATACGFNPRPREVMGDSQVEMSDGTLRLPIHTAVTHLDRVRVTKRFGAPITPPLTFEILGRPDQGPSGLVLALRRVADGSDT